MDAIEKWQQIPAAVKAKEKQLPVACLQSATNFKYSYSEILKSAGLGKFRQKRIFYKMLAAGETFCKVLAAGEISTKCASSPSAYYLQAVKVISKVTGACKGEQFAEFECRCK